MLFYDANLAVLPEWGFATVTALLGPITGPDLTLLAYSDTIAPEANGRLDGTLIKRLTARGFAASRCPSLMAVWWVYELPTDNFRAKFARRDLANMKNTPIWWEDAPLLRTPSAPIAPSCDVAIVGAGYTGLSAAITLARAGRKVQVFDKMRAGEGASSRNGGIASGNLRPSLQAMIGRFGKARALAIHAEAKCAREDLMAFITRENIDCDYKLTGRFTGATSPAQYDILQREAELLTRTLGIEAFALDRTRQRDALGTDYYYGGVVRMDIGGLHPAKLLAGMLRLATAAGAVVADATAVTRICTHGAGL